MELFHEYKNKYFHLVLKILNLCENGLEKKEILKIIDDEGYEEKLITKDFKTFEEMICNEYEEENLNLLKEEDNKYYPVLNDGLPMKIRFSYIEKTWLKGMIEDKQVQALLGEKIIDKLNRSLQDINEGSNEVIEITNKNKNEIKKDIHKINSSLFTLLDAIKNEKMIKYTNIDRNNNEHKDIFAVPLRIEYSLKDDKFRASLYSVEGKRPVMVNLHTLKEITIVDDTFEMKREEIIKNIKKIRYCEEPVTIILKDIRGAMERCFMSFSSFERRSKKIDKSTYEVDIYYYSFQEMDVISRIISLGPYVTVKGPERIRNLTIDKIKKSFHYQNE